MSGQLGRTRVWSAGDNMCLVCWGEHVSGQLVRTRVWSAVENTCLVSWVEYMSGLPGRTRVLSAVTDKCLVCRVQLPRQIMIYGAPRGLARFSRVTLS